MAKYYRLIKDHPYWETGAIVTPKTDSSDSNYIAIDDLWVKEIKGLEPDPQEYSAVVEESPKLFERVWPVSILKKVRYMSKSKAKAAHDKLYKE